MRPVFQPLRRTCHFGSEIVFGMYAGQRTGDQVEESPREMLENLPRILEPARPPDQVADNGRGSAGAIEAAPVFWM